MRRGYALCCAALTVMALSCAPARDALTDADIQAIHQIGQEFAQAVAAHDFDRAVALHTEDAVWMNPNAPAAVGADALKRSFEAGPRALTFTITPIHTEGIGPLAYDRGSYEYRGLVGADTIAERGKYLEVLRRHPDGSWRIAVDIWNSDEMPMAPAMAPAPPRKR
jgi:ketosteroid isomerase-like protein